MTRCSVHVHTHEGVRTERGWLWVDLRDLAADTREVLADYLRAWRDR